MIAVVDDNADIAAAIVRLLKHQGHDAVAFESCELFLDGLKHHKPYVVILDVMMPELSGIECLEIMRSTPQWRAIPVVIYSADSDPATVNEAKRVGANEYVVKGEGGWAYMASVIEQLANAGKETA